MQVFFKSDNLAIRLVNTYRYNSYLITDKIHTKNFYIDS